MLNFIVGEAETILSILFILSKIISRPCPLHKLNFAASFVQYSMLKSLRPIHFPFRLLAFWLLFFVVFRLWFVLWFRSEWPDENPGVTWLSFWYALPLDFSFAAYLLALPIILWQAGIAFGSRSYPFVEKSIFGFNVLVFSIFIFVFGANVFLYEEWQTPLNNRAVEYFKTPSALLDSMSFPFKLASFGIYAGAVWLILRCYRKVVGTKIYYENTSRWSLLAFPIWLGILVLAIRGGTGVMPINESAVYYSPHLFDNHAATNPGWSLCHSLIETRSTVNRYAVMEDDVALKGFGSLMGTGLECNNEKIQFFDRQNSTELNVVFLILESHTAQVIEELGGEPGVCPNMSRLIREGILFKNIYGSGYRTDQGIISILAGYPAQPDQSIILLEDKAAKLPSIPKILKDSGYSTLFLYGGELTFANLGLWLTNQRFDKILSERDFTNAEKTQRWGVDDGILFQRTIKEINGLRPPFFATAMTLSLHPPYDVPFQSKWAANNDREKFLNSAAFVDHGIGEFFNSAEQQSWYANTIFVLVADHGASQPGGLGMDRPESRHTPLIIFGKPIVGKAMNVEVFGNHHDIPATILSMIHKGDQARKFIPWSQDLFMKVLSSGIPGGDCQKYAEGFAYYTNENGLGWATPTGKGFYEFGSKEWRIFEGKLDSVDRLNAQSYLQTLYNDFLAK
ncbi:MAG: LTA synthase family protein [Saprospiraceae bacterium]